MDVLEVSPDVDCELAFRLRPAPTRTQELKVLVPPYSDPRSTPRRKGPDIALLEGLRTDARELYGCDEVLLIDGDGYVIEGATTSLLWWDGDTLCVTDLELGALPSVTSAVIVEEALNRSVPVESRRVRPRDFSGTRCGSSTRSTGFGEGVNSLTGVTFTTVCSAAVSRIRLGLSVEAGPVRMRSGSAVGVNGWKRLRSLRACEN